MYFSVGMQVVYPALDSKVKNVTLAYTVEHEDEVHDCSRGGRHTGLVVLFSQLVTLQQAMCICSVPKYYHTHMQFAAEATSMEQHRRGLLARSRFQCCITL